MSSDRLLQLARWGALLLCASTVLVAVLDVGEPTGISGLAGKPLLVVLAVFYCLLLGAILRPGITRILPAQKTLLLQLAMAASVVLDFDNLASLNLFALPFVVPVDRRRPWLLAQAGILAFQFLGWLKFYDPAQHAKLLSLAETQRGEFVAAVGAGLLQLFAWAVFAYFVGSLLVQLETDRRSLARANAELRATHTMLSETARIEERLRISRELHDSVGHYLTSLGLQLEIAENIGDGAAAGPIGRAKLLVRLLLAEVREAASEWRVERPDALPAAIRELCQGVTRVKIHLDLAADLPPASPGTTHAVFRIVQEALTNTLRHSSARSFSVRLENAGGAYDLEVRDDGNPEARFELGTGLRGMTERVAELGGTIQFDTARGFRIQASIPSAKGRQA